MISPSHLGGGVWGEAGSKANTLYHCHQPKYLLYLTPSVPHSRGERGKILDLSPYQTGGGVWGEAGSKANALHHCRILDKPLNYLKLDKKVVF